MSLNKLITNINKLPKFNFKHIKPLLYNYSENDWKKYKSFTKSYSKKLIYKNNLYDMYLISWNINSISKIHDHSSNGCLMKVLDGKLSEDIFDHNLNYSKNNIYNKNNISYINNSIGYHSIENIYQEKEVQKQQEI